MAKTKTALQLRCIS